VLSIHASNRHTGFVRWRQRGRSEGWPWRLVAVAVELGRERGNIFMIALSLTLRPEDILETPLSVVRTNA